MAVKKRTEPDWRDIRTFNALARHGSLSATARALSITHATVARRIASLEDALGQILVDRRPEGYFLTDAGSRILGAASAMEAAATALMSDLQCGESAGLVRINATPSLVECFLVSHLQAFAFANPSVDVDLATDMRSVSLDRYEADIALRLGKPESGDLLAKPLVTMGFGLYASRTWHNRLASREAPVFVGFDEANAHLPEAAWLKRQFPRARVSLRASSHSIQAEAAASGHGIALLPAYVAAVHPDLVRCELGPTPPDRKLWLVLRRKDRHRPPVRLMAEFLANVFRERQRLFEGASPSPGPAANPAPAEC